MMQVGENYFRVHPKGVGIICQRPDGLPPLTFVEEYLGEVHTPSRWFEVQVGCRRSLSEVFVSTDQNACDVMQPGSEGCCCTRLGQLPTHTR